MSFLKKRGWVEEREEEGGRENLRLESFLSRPPPHTAAKAMHDLTQRRNGAKKTGGNLIRLIPQGALKRALKGTLGNVPLPLASAYRGQ